MRRVIFRRHGDPAEVLEIVEESDPVPGPGEVRIRPTVMVINPADLLGIEGRYGAEPTRLPATPGFGAYGIIDAVGPDVDRFSVGDAVLPAGVGVWADRVIAKARMTTPAPAGADPEQVAMMRHNAATAEAMLTGFSGLAEDDWVVQNAANSAVGRQVIRFARAKGVKTVNIVRRDDAAKAIAPDQPDAVIVDPGAVSDHTILAATGGERPKLALDAVGGEATAALAGSVVDGGTVVVYGLLSREDSRVPVRDLVFRDVRVRGFWLAAWYASADPDAIRDLEAFLQRELAAGAIHAAVEARYPLSRVHEAVAHAARGGRSGKILLTGEDNA